MHTRFLLAAALASVSPAQIGGHGGDGAFTPTSSTSLATDRGPWYFTRIAIPQGVTVRLTGAAPALLLCTGDVDIDGELRADGGAGNVNVPGAPGPGGYAGGSPATAGGGPGGGGGGGAACSGWFGCFVGSGGGGGHATPGMSSGTILGGAPGRSYGYDLPFEIQGGGGGGGSGVLGAIPGVGGSGGGGVLVILADGAVTVRGRLSARGGDSVYANNASGGAGGGGALLLRSMRALTVATGQIDARGGSGVNPPYADGGVGFVRLDAYGSRPVLGGQIMPAPRVNELPTLATELPFLNPRRGASWDLTSVSVPDDVMVLCLSLSDPDLPLPPFGRLHIDPGAFLVVDQRSCSLSHEPLAVFHVPVPDHPGLLGLTVYAQAINAVTAAAQPRLSTGVAGTIR